MTVAEKIKSLRRELGLTQVQLGELLGVQKNAVSKWECGRVEDIPGQKIKAMAAIFGVPPSYLIDDDLEDIHLIISDNDPQIAALLDTAKKLNAKGLERLGQYAEDLSANPKYLKKNGGNP